MSRRLSPHNVLFQFPCPLQLELIYFRFHQCRIRLRLLHLFLLWRVPPLMPLYSCQLRISVCLPGSSTPLLTWILRSLNTGNLMIWFVVLLLNECPLTILLLFCFSFSFRTTGFCSAREFFTGFSESQQFCMNCLQLTHLLGSCVSPPYCLRCRASHHMRYFDVKWFSFWCRMLPLCLLYSYLFSFAVVVLPWANITSNPLVLLPFPSTKSHLMRNSVSTTTCASLCLSMHIYNFR